MKFVVKERGQTSENSSGGGTEGVLKEMFLVVLAYAAVIVSILVAFFAVIVAAQWINFDLSSLL